MEGSSAAGAPLVIGRYELHGVIASGGMATVHFGRLNGPGGFTRTVAIKRLRPAFVHDPEFVSMFVDEAKLASKIRHPNVVSILDVVSTAAPPELFLVMEYVQGETLARLLFTARDASKPPPPAVVSAILGGVLRGLHAAHEASHPTRGPLGIVHRDVSPQNVMVGVDGAARLLDFGVAKAVDRLQVTRDRQLKGKVPYMAPEQVTAKPVTRATDVFAASIVLWEALTARRLFVADQETQVMKQILTGAIEPPSRFAAPGSLPDAAALDAVVLRGLERSAARRWPTAKDMAAALEAALPPATASEVGEWVEANARVALEERVAQLAQLARAGTGEARYSTRPPPALARASAPPPPPPSRRSRRRRRRRALRRALRTLERTAPYAALAGLLALAASIVYLLAKR